MNVLITGAAGGFGRAAANECARLGYRLFLTDLNEAGLICLKQGLERQFDADVVIKACDLTDPVSVDEMLRSIDHHGIRFDMLLNIAGLDHEGTFMSRSAEQLAEIIALNNAATIRITHAILQRERGRQPGIGSGKEVNTVRPFTIVFMSSLASMFPMPVKATYAASKRFILDIALALRCELRDQGVKVMTVCPGGMVTTREAAEAIDAQGFWGGITTSPLEIVARRMIHYALAGKAVYIPGVFNSCLAVLGKHLPAGLVASVVYRRWSAAAGKRDPLRIVCHDTLS